jgi:hypothetical protein
MECDSPTVGRNADAPCPELIVAQRAPVCILITASREAAWETARKIARGTGSGLSWIDCDRTDPDEMADLLRQHVVSPPVSDRILFLREIQVLDRGNQKLLNELIATQQPPRNRPRLIASASLSLYEWVCAGLFEETLFYKLNAVHITP